MLLQTTKANSIKVLSSLRVRDLSSPSQRLLNGGIYFCLWGRSAQVPLGPSVILAPLHQQLSPARLPAVGLEGGQRVNGALDVPPELPGRQPGVFCKGREPHVAIIGLNDKHGPRGSGGVGICHPMRPTWAPADRTVVSLEVHWLVSPLPRRRGVKSYRGYSPHLTVGGKVIGYRVSLLILRSYSYLIPYPSTFPPPR